MTLKKSAVPASDAYADLPAPHVFDIVIKHDNPRQMERLPLTVRAVTQQWAKPFPEIPHGWRRRLRPVSCCDGRKKIVSA
jgi:hypothetical protein